MANIYSYPQIGELADADNLIISDASNGNKTKSVTIEQLSDYFSTGGGGVDNYVNGGSYSSGTLTLTRTGSLSDIDISGFSTFDGQYSSLTGAPTLATVATSGSYNDLTNKPTIPPAYGDSDVDTHLNTDTAQANEVLSWTGSAYDWVAQSGGGGGDTYDLNAGAKSVNSVPLNLTSGSGGDNSVVNLTEGSNITLTQTSATEITIDSASPTGSQLYKTTFTGNTLVNAFNGNLSDKIVLVSVPAGKIAIIENALFIIKAGSTGTTNYNAGNALHVLPEGATSIWGPRLVTSALNASHDYVLYSADVGSGSDISQYGGVGADIILGPPGSGGGPVDISQGDRDVVISIVYRIVDF